MSREDEIQMIAYRIWEEEGWCHGRDVEHWLKAEIIWEEQQKPAVSNLNINPEIKTTPLEKKVHFLTETKNINKPRKGSKSSKPKSSA